MSTLTEIPGWRVTADKVQQTHPVRDGAWVDIVLELLEVATGVRREKDDCITYRPDEDGEAPSPFWWSDGNGSCDCNRQLYFWRAGGEPDDADVECGSDRFKVNLRNPVSGEVFYREFE